MKTYIVSHRHSMLGHVLAKLAAQEQISTTVTIEDFDPFLVTPTERREPPKRTYHSAKGFTASQTRMRQKSRR
jgi:hypothetical protein